VLSQLSYTPIIWILHFIFYHLGSNFNRLPSRKSRNIRNNNNGRNGEATADALGLIEAQLQFLVKMRINFRRTRTKSDKDLRLLARSWARLKKVKPGAGTRRLFFSYLLSLKCSMALAGTLCGSTSSSVCRSDCYRDLCSIYFGKFMRRIRS
jgi:hypothetical protein